jgi:DNA-binding CsgD family transcriptional regulator
MNTNERRVLLLTLLLIVLVVAIDLITDTSQGVILWHLLVEGSAGAIALVGVLYLLHQQYQLKGALQTERQLSAAWQKESEQWRSQAKAYLAGLSVMIDQQLSAWGLSPSEREVAFFLLKGMSLKEIAVLRNTTEKTARVQSTAIYAKSGLNGRSELSAFFLEDLLPKTSAES